jgi:hypothetical protein
MSLQWMCLPATAGAGPVLRNWPDQKPVRPGGA